MSKYYRILQNVLEIHAKYFFRKDKFALVLFFISNPQVVIILCLIFFKKLNLPILVGQLSAIQSFSHTLIFNFPWSWGWIRKLAFMSHWEPVSFQPAYDTQEYQTVSVPIQLFFFQAPLRVTPFIFQFTTWSRFIS